MFHQLACKTNNRSVIPNASDPFSDSKDTINCIFHLHECLISAHQGRVTHSHSTKDPAKIVSSSKIKLPKKIILRSPWESCMPSKIVVLPSSQLQLLAFSRTHHKSGSVDTVVQFFQSLDITPQYCAEWHGDRAQGWCYIHPSSPLPSSH